jgi:ArsR family transcriptional regulator
VAKQQVEEPTHEYSIISRDELIARLHDHALSIVDVMPRETYADGHIPGAINLPLAEVEASARGMLPNFAREIAVYCSGPT